MKMPQKPALGDGGKWTFAKRKKIHMRWVKVAFPDADEPITGVMNGQIEGDTDEDDFGGDPTLFALDGYIGSDAYPYQVIEIGPKLVAGF